jgi:hypothetical protein
MATKKKATEKKLAKKKEVEKKETPKTIRHWNGEAWTTRTIN